MTDNEKKSNPTSKIIVEKEPTIFDLIIIFLIGVVIINLYVQLFNLNTLPGIIKIFILLLTLYMVSLTIAKIFKTESHYGIVMVRSQRYISIIDQLATKYKKELIFFSDIAVAMAFGIFSYFMIKEKKKTKVALGIVLAMIINLLVMPFIFPLTAQLISAKEIKEYREQVSTQRSEPLVSLILIGLTALFGYIASSFILLFLQTLIIINLFVQAFNNQIPAEKITPGAVPIIPGITIPLIEGIIALAIILIVHESFHGLIARIHDIEIKSTGLVFFGPIPIGAFVDPDEDKLFKLEEKLPIKRVVSSGPVSNLILSLVILITLLIFNFSMFFLFAESNIKNLQIF
ncbi:MAG: site-2 protease family protein, partial [Candidatus Anstonellales archaeon]